MSLRWPSWVREHWRKPFLWSWLLGLGVQGQRCCVSWWCSDTWQVFEFPHWHWSCLWGTVPLRPMARLRTIRWLVFSLLRNESMLSWYKEQDHSLTSILDKKWEHAVSLKLLCTAPWPPSWIKNENMLCHLNSSALHLERERTLDQRSSVVSSGYC